MFKFKRGFAPILVFLIILAVAFGIVFYMTRNKKKANASGIGLQTSVASINVVIPQTASKHVIDVTSTGASAYLMKGYPTTKGPGITMTPSSGGISPGQTVQFKIEIINTAVGDYSGTQILENQNYSPNERILIPVNVKVVEQQCLYDVNHDTAINSADLGLVSKNYGNTTPGNVYDVNSDGAVNSIDLGLVANHYGQRCPSASLLK